MQDDEEELEEEEEEEEEVAYPPKKKGKSVVAEVPKKGQKVAAKTAAPAAKPSKQTKRPVMTFEDLEDDHDEHEDGVVGGLDDLDDDEFEGEEGEGDHFGDFGADFDDGEDDEFDEDEEMEPAKKIQMDFNSDDEDGEGGDDDDENDDEMEIEREARELDAENEELERLGEEELQTNIEQREKFILPSGQEVEYDTRQNEDLALVQTRIQEIVRVLGNFAELKEADRSRSEYIEQLQKDLALYYGYNDYLMEKLFNLFPISEAIEFFEANEVQRPVVIRTNTLKTRRRDLAQALINRGVNLEPVGKWTKVGLQIFDSPVPIGATPEYLSGHYMLQAASSFLPVIALAPQENERILDMCAAPGGKTTHLSALLKNTGCVFANDANADRAKGLIANIHRLGCRNVVVCNYDGREFPGVIGGFDRVLLDSPCSGTGVIAKDPSVKVNKSDADFNMLAQIQRELILAAIDSVDATSKTGGYIVYSTCAVTVEENEEVVNYALKKRPNVKLVSTGLDFGKEGFTSYRGKTFHPSLKLTRRYYPHTYNMDGFFVSKFKKMANKISEETGAEDEEEEVKEAKEDVKSKVAGGKKKVEEVESVGFDEEEDEKFMKAAEAKRLKKMGIRPISAGSEPTIAEKKAERQQKKLAKKTAMKELKEAPPAVAEGEKGSSGRRKANGELLEERALAGLEEEGEEKVEKVKAKPVAAVKKVGAAKAKVASGKVGK
ncbi:rRNA (cytosine-C5-)-methyltransferase nop2 [Blyttiomyces sp. JEL0837]|nr:rRNA (cytosine-C5-)-methyltransferase nop2 [Blyttiomyces sp. JEL0837]